MTEAAHTGIETLACYARGLHDDLIAVKAGLTLEWSNGVNRGSDPSSHAREAPRVWAGAGFALSRQRVLPAA